MLGAAIFILTAIFSACQVVEQRLVLHNVDKEDQGSYACLVMDHSDNKQVGTIVCSNQGSD